MKVIIAGSRDFNDYDLLCRSIQNFTNNSLFPITEVVSGTQKGADSLGEKWAEENNIPKKLFPPDWNKYNKAAGPIRNELMAKYADYLILFWDGTIKGNKGRGSKNMLENMVKLNKPYILISY